MAALLEFGCALWTALRCLCRRCSFPLGGTLSIVVRITAEHRADLRKQVRLPLECSYKHLVNGTADFWVVACFFVSEGSTENRGLSAGIREGFITCIHFGYRVEGCFILLVDCASSRRLSAGKDCIAPRHLASRIDFFVCELGADICDKDRGKAITIFRSDCEDKEVDAYP
jgi:hypothetical protein